MTAYVHVGFGSMYTCTLCTSVLYMHACTCMYSVSELLQCAMYVCIFVLQRGFEEVAAEIGQPQFMESLTMALHQVRVHLQMTPF